LLQKCPPQNTDESIQIKNTIGDLIKVCSVVFCLTEYNARFADTLLLRSCCSVQKLNIQPSAGCSCCVIM
jgi:hypothetical protein